MCINLSAPISLAALTIKYPLATLSGFVTRSEASEIFQDLREVHLL